MEDMAIYWALTAAIFILGLLFGYIGRTLISDIRATADFRSELDEAMEKSESAAKSESRSHGHTEAAILKNLDRNSNR